jgi:hypothetical protein
VLYRRRCATSQAVTGVQVLQCALTWSDLIDVQVLPFRYPAAHQLMYMPMWDPNAESLVTGPSQDDHDGGPAAGVASGFDPSGGEPCYQFGNQWVSWHEHVLGNASRLSCVACCHAVV